MKVLLTGIPGWLGNRFLELVVKGFPNPGLSCRDWELRCLLLEGSDTSFIQGLRDYKDIAIVTGDVTKKETLKDAFKDIDVVFHAAGIIHPRNVNELYAVNTVGADNMISAALQVGVSRFIYISSNSAAGINKSRDDLMKEADQPRPYLNYGLSKLCAENIIRRSQESGKIETVILRPCWFYGPNQPDRQSRFFKMIQQGNPIVFGNGLNLRSMSYVDNVSLGMALAATRPEAAGQTYWIADARPYTTLEIYQTVAELLEVKNFKPRFVPGLLSEACFLADKILQSFGAYQTEIHVAGEMNKNIACSIEKARKELGYEPFVELREGMQRSIEWCRQNRLI